MPIIALPEGINKALELAGIVKNEESNETLLTKLDDAGLDEKFLLNELALIARSSDSDSTRMRAIESALKMRGMLNPYEEGNQPKITLVLYTPQIRSINDFKTIDITSK